MDNVTASLQTTLEKALRDPNLIGPDWARLIGQVHEADGNLASGFFRRLTEWIQQFEATLDEEHEVALRLVSFGQAVAFHLQNIAYWNPSLIRFQGVTDTGQPVQLVQHISQISLLLMKAPRALPHTPKSRIGFTPAGPAGV